MIGAIVTQILNVTAYIHEHDIYLSYLDFSNVFIKGDLIKLSSFGVSIFKFKDEDKHKQNDLRLIGKFLATLQELLAN